MLTRTIGRFQILLQRIDVAEQLVFHGKQELPRPGARLRVRGHQLRMREALIDVLVDDVRLVEHQVTIHQHRHAVVRIDDRDVFRLVEQVDVDHLEVHLLLVEDDPAAMAERAGGTRVQIHHGTRTPGIVGIAYHFANRWCANFTMPHMQHK